MGVNLRLDRAAWWAAALLLCACPSDDSAPPAPVEDYDSGLPPFLDAGRSDGGNRDGGDSAADAAPSLGPLIELLEPTVDSIVVGSTLNARCHVERNPEGEPVDPASVKVALYADDTATAFVTQVANSTGEADVFTADISLVAAPHGRVRVECSADDVTTGKHHNSSSLSVLVDRGPSISFLSPAEDGFVKGDVSEGEDARIRFKVEPQSLSDDDTGAAIDDIAVTVNGKAIASIEESSTEEYVYSFGLDFGDDSFFTVVPNTLSVRVDARNVRMPAGSASTILSVGVDGDGPEITVRAPLGVGGVNPIVSGKVDVVLEIKDELAGVDPTSVAMTISGRTYPVDALGNGRYGSTFEVGEFPNTADLTLNFTAKDKNGISTKASQIVRIDDQPPWVSLMPHLVRELSVKAPPTPNECSGAFDPLGDAPDDGQIISKAVRLRALAWDRARRVSGQQILHYAMVDPESVDIVVQHDPGVPLLINSRGIPGGPCDAINLQPAGGATAPVVIELDALTPAGTAPLGLDPVVVGPNTIEWESNLADEPNVVGQCSPKGGTPPTLLCSNPYMTRMIKHTVPGNFAVVFGINFQASSICTGDFYSTPTPGPLCMVAQARDTAGNSSFSAPLRLCAEYPDGEDNVETCPDGVLDGITCTDGCILPANFGPNASDRMPSVIRID
jgi:hypothetical protein